MPGSWSCRKGAALLIPSGPREGHKHLFAVLLDPLKVDCYGNAPHVLLACVVSIQPGRPPLESACLLEPGEHDFITHASYVDYRFTRLERAEHVDRRVAEGVFVEKGDCSDVLLRKIIAGAMASRRISREYKLLLESVQL